jgi:uncharacterized protein (TIGR02588 family)
MSEQRNDPQQGSRSEESDRNQEPNQDKREEGSSGSQNRDSEAKQSGSDKQQKGQKEQKGGKSGQGKNMGPTTTEWVVGIGSTLLVLALLGFVIYTAVSGTDSPPVVAVRVERVFPVPGGYMVEVAAYNEGGTTAAALTIEGTLKQDTVTVETSTATISYVPAETEREAGLFFTQDPRRHTLEVRPLGYDRP